MWYGTPILITVNHDKSSTKGSLSILVNYRRVCRLWLFTARNVELSRWMKSVLDISTWKKGQEPWCPAMFVSKHHDSSRVKHVQPMSARLETKSDVTCLDGCCRLPVGCSLRLAIGPRAWVQARHWCKGTPNKIEQYRKETKTYRLNHIKSTSTEIYHK